MVWAVDFQFDADKQDRPIKICSIIDEHTRECIGEADVQLGRHPHWPVLHSTGLAVAQRVRRVIQQPDPQRMPQHQQLLLAIACASRDRRLEQRVQPSPTTLIARLSTPSQTCPAMNPPNRNQRLTKRPDRTKGATHLVLEPVTALPRHDPNPSPKTTGTKPRTLLGVARGVLKEQKTGQMSRSRT